MKLLIVDDEPLTRKGLINCMNWSTLGITQIFESDDGLSALEIACHEKPELIMCDIHMPRMNGIQMAEKLETFLPNTSLIFMSGYSDREYLKAAIKLKAISYIDKPLNSNEVKESVLEAIKCHHQKELSIQNNTLYSLELTSQLALLLTKPYNENQTKIHSLIDQLGLDLSSNCTYMTYIVRLRTTESNTLIFNTIYNALSELLLGYHLNVLYIQSHTHYHIYHIIGNQAISHSVQTIIESFLKDHFTSFKDFFIGHSHPTVGISRAYQSYCSVVVLMQSSFFFQSSTILCPQESVCTCADLLTSAISTEPWINFNEALSTKNQLACSELLSQLFKSYYQNFILLPNQVKDIYYKLFMVLNDNCKKLRFSINSSEESIIESLENCFTYQELHQILTNKVHLFFNTLNNYKPEDSIIFLIKDYVDKHYTEDNLSIKEISDHVFLSVSYVCTYFKNQTGQTLNQYITDYRMEKAIQLLADTRYQIVDISAKVGYSNGNYFSKSFKKYTGLSPSKYLYKNLRFQTKLTLIHLLTASVPLIVLGLFFHVKLYDMIIADTIRKEQPATAYTASLIEDSVSYIVDICNQITNTNFFKALSLPQTSTSLSILTTSEDAISFQETLNELTNNNIVKSIKIYIDIPITNPIFYHSSPDSTILSIDNTHGTYWNGIFNGNPELETLFCPSFYLDSYEIQHYGDSAYITKFILNYENKKIPCFLTLYLDTSYFESLLKDNLTSSSNVVYLINNRDNLIATSNLALYGTYHFSYAQVQSYFMSSNNFIQKQVLNEPVYASFYNIKNTDWYLVVAMPSQPIINKAIYVMFQLILIYIICMLITFSITSLLSHSITSRLSLVISQMSKARIAPPIALPPPDTQDEIGDLVSTYNYMTRVIEQLMGNQVKVAEDLRIAEFNSLQAQINPHFLYNTMDMINWLSQQGQVSEVTNSIQKLSRFYKLTLNRKESLSTIEAEIEHVSIYVELQNMRFCNAIDFIIDIPDNLLEYTIPKLTLQPVIENSILHGILEKSPREGIIVLTGWMEDSTIVILISDDGIGISSEKLPNILKCCEQPSQYGHSNIAVYNTHRRLQLMYGSSYGLTYSSIYGQGTDVEIRIPRF